MLAQSGFNMTSSLAATSARAVAARRLPSMTRAASSSAVPPPPASRDASRPYARGRQELPPLQSSSNRLLALFGIVGGTLASWALFTAHATNRERLGSSVLRAALDRVREDGDVREQLGASRDPDGEGNIKLERSAWLFGDAWIGGSVSVCRCVKCCSIDEGFSLAGHVSWA